MPKQTRDPEPIFQALADPTRRTVLLALLDGPASVSDLYEQHDMALPSFVRHIGVLEDAGLITSRKKGRVRTCRLAPKALRGIDDWLSPFRQQWAPEPAEPRYARLAKSLYSTPAKAKPGRGTQR